MTAKAAARTLQAAEHLGSLACNHQKLEEAREASPRPPRPSGCRARRTP